MLSRSVCEYVVDLLFCFCEYLVDLCFCEYLVQTEFEQRESSHWILHFDSDLWGFVFPMAHLPLQSWSDNFQCSAASNITPSENTVKAGLFLFYDHPGISLGTSGCRPSGFWTQLPTNELSWSCACRLREIKLFWLPEKKIFGAADVILQVFGALKFQ